VGNAFPRIFYAAQAGFKVFPSQSNGESCHTVVSQTYGDEGEVDDSLNDKTGYSSYKTDQTVCVTTFERTTQTNV
jgi:hypothetical protein